MFSAEEVIRVYAEMGSLKGTARATGFCEAKVRKIRLTAGIKTDSARTEKILELHKSGMTAAEIAAKLKISQKAVNSHLPYQRGEYGREDATQNALDIRAWRGKRKTT